MKCGYDNLDDAQSKLTGTFCMYKGKAVSIKSVLPHDADPNNGNYEVYGTYLKGRKEFHCHIDDKEFNCSDFNLGYAFRPDAAMWFYRNPAKQYKQGLRYDQVGFKVSNRKFAAFDFKALGPVADMLEGNYPTFEEAVKTLRDLDAIVVPFHRNFALTFDDIHEDFIIEYKGVNVGFTSNCEEFRLLRQHSHLYESLKEAISA